MSQPNEEAPKAVSRRGFIAAGACVLSACYAGLAGAAVVKYLAVQDDAPGDTVPSEVTVAAADVPVAGEAVVFAFGRDHALLFRDPQGKLHAFSAKCTHSGCTVRYQAETNHLVCPCHGGTFDAADGAILKGPPKRPLPAYSVKERDGAAVVRPLDRG